MHFMLMLGREGKVGRESNFIKDYRLHKHDHFNDIVDNKMKMFIKRLINDSVMNCGVPVYQVTKEQYYWLCLRPKLMMPSYSMNKRVKRELIRRMVDLNILIKPNRYARYVVLNPDYFPYKDDIYIQYMNGLLLRNSVRMGMTSMNEYLDARFCLSPEDRKEHIMLAPA